MLSTLLAIITLAGPPAPTVIAPAGTHIGGKPMIAFAGANHVAFRLRITRDAAGSDVAWSSGPIPSSGFCAPCRTALEDGAYFASAQISDGADWSPWSKPVRFAIDRRSEGIDVRHMDEPNLLTASAPAPDDMFGFRLPMAEERSGKAAVVQSSCLGRTNSMLRIEDNGHGPPTDFLRRHCVQEIDLDRGVTIVAAVRVQAQQVFSTNPVSVVPIWEQGQIMVAAGRDQVEPVMASFRVMRDIDWTGKMAYVGRRNVVGACTDNRSWQEADLGFESDHFIVVRITGRNQTTGDFTTTRWTIYANEAPSPVLIAVGTMPQPIVDPDRTWMTTSCVVVGNGYASCEGVWDFDWLAVNLGGDYAPGEWDFAPGAYVPGGGKRDWNGPYAGIAAIRGADETAFASANRAAMVTRVAKELSGQQTGFYIQDDTGGIRIDSPGGGFGVNSGSLLAAEPGREVRWIRGIVPWPVNLVRVSENIDSVCYRANPEPAFFRPLVAMTPALSEAKPRELTLKELIGDGPVSSPAAIPNAPLGSFVSVKGKLALQECDPATSYWVYYIDDGTNPKAIDGRAGPELVGLRIVRRRDDNDPGSHIRVWANTTWRIDGIVTYEPNGLGQYVLTLTCPSFTML